MDFDINSPNSLAESLIVTEDKRALMRAVEQFTANVTIPVLHEAKREVVDQVGTGTLFDHGGRLILVTARHIFDEIDPKNLIIPSTKTKKLHRVGEYNLYRTDVDDIDIALVEIRNQSTIQRARDNWRILTIDKIGDPSPDGHFILSGYPTARAIRAGGLLGGSLLTIHTERLEEAPEGATQPVHPDLDLFFHYEREGMTIEGSMQEVPELPGCSGASIWEYREPPGMLFWSAEQCLRVVGVQSSYFSSRGFFRAKRGAYVKDMIERVTTGSVETDT